MKPFVPDTLPLPTLDWEPLVRLVGEANAALARFDGILQGIINPGVLLSPLTTQEAVLSSKIEGTEATLQEVLEFEASPTPEGRKAEDIREIVNYRIALQTAVKLLEKLPISLNMVKEIHAILLASVRGKNKGRGEFRSDQNWIGKPGCKIEEAMYVPPEPLQLLEHLSNWEKYVHYDEKDRLVQLAVIHAQFEIIHPFLDGNGRVGRILIPLFLFEKGLLSSPVFYLSAYLEANRDVYYDRLESISASKDWQGWILFFLTAVMEQAKRNSEKAKEILKVYDDMKKEISRITRSQFSIQALDCLFMIPIFKTTDFIERSGIPKPTALRILNALEKAKVILPIRKGKGRRAGVLMFPKLLEIAQK
ncbi:MAG: Fic/DOC family N-terminal domain-containing protein [bacterium]|mgnify:CR=1 FL=1